MRAAKLWYMPHPTKSSRRDPVEDCGGLPCPDEPASPSEKVVGLVEAGSSTRSQTRLLPRASICPSGHQDLSAPQFASESPSRRDTKCHIAQQLRGSLASRPQSSSHVGAPSSAHRSPWLTRPVPLVGCPHDRPDQGVQPIRRLYCFLPGHICCDVPASVPMERVHPADLVCG